MSNLHYRWDPLVQAAITEESREQARILVEGLIESRNIPREEAQRIFDETIAEAVWVNSTYQVSVRGFVWPDHTKGVHLSIKRHDKEPVTDWRDKQSIKNQLVGKECEGVELFPAESRLVDTANQYHIWCLADAGLRLPLGWEGRLVMDEQEGGDKQRHRTREECDA